MTPTRMVGRGILAALLVMAASRAAEAQVWGPTAASAAGSTWRPELQLDWFGGRASAVHAGGGLSARAGNYLRIGVNAAAGVALADSVRNVAHVDATARFMLDPFRQQRIGVSAGGGVGVRHEGDGIRAFALIFVDAEAGREGRWTPFLRAGVGGGLLITAGVRRAAARSR